MRRINPRSLPLVLLGVMLLLSILGVCAGIASFVLLRAGYGPLVWGLLPPLALLLITIVILLWWAAGGPLPGRGRHSGSEEQPREGPPRGEPRR